MILLITQILFTLTAIWAKYNLSGVESFVNGLKGSWLIIYLCIYHIATFMQLYIFKQTNILKAMAFFSALSVILTVGVGYLLLNETIDWRDLISIILVLTALIIINSEQTKTK